MTLTLSPPRWTLDQFRQGAAKGVAVFQRERESEARDDYTNHFNDARSAIEDVFEISNDLTSLSSTGWRIVTSARYIEALRYLAAPPISTDDLATLSGLPEGHWYGANNWPVVVSTVLSVIDLHRFPWLTTNREPTDPERYAAIVATAAQIAARRIMTARANESKTEQENLVKTSLREAGFSEVQARPINTLRSAPKPGEFCGESMLGSRKADLVVSLWDDRVLAIECKVSNSKVNSVKRVKNDAAVKARLWIQEFGTQLIVPAAVIAGVYHPPNLLSAQADGLTIWWSHDIDQMISWVSQTQPGRRTPI